VPIAISSFYKQSLWILQNFLLSGFRLAPRAAKGFSKTVLTGIIVDLNKTAMARIAMEVGQVSTTVEVSGATQQIDTTTAQIATNYDTKETQDLPTASVGLGVLNLSLLNAGVATSGGVGAGTGPSVSGQRPRNNNFTIEGVDNNNKSVTGPLVTVPNDAVQSFTVLQNQFNPEFGHSSGGQFNEVVMSGTNQFHGRLYEYFQNRNLNAIDSQVAMAERGNGQNPSNTRYDNNRFGGQVGGPIIKDKLFFFTNQEYNPIGEVTSSSGCAPTAAGYALLDAQASAGLISSNNYKVMKQYLGTSSAQATAAGDACPGSVSVNGVTVPTGDIGFQGSLFSNTYTTVNSIDYNISQNDQLRFRYIYSKNSTLDNAAQLPTFWIPIPTRNHVITLDEFHVFSPKMTNELRLGYNRYFNEFPVGSQTFPGLSVFPNLSLDDMNGVNIGPDPNAPQSGIQNTYQVTDNVSWMIGKHNLTLGMEYRKYISPQTFTQRVRGDYYWATTQDYLNDVAPTDFGERSTGNPLYNADQYAIYGYGNDEWRITSHLTIDLGLRYEFTKVPAAQQSQSLNAIASVPGLIDFTTPTSQTKNFAPRIGFAYSPGKSGNTSIRGGYGIAYDVLYDNLGILSLPPELQGTCDVGNTPSATCYYSNTGFLANGGLPSGKGGLVTFANALDARSATSAYVPNQKLPYSETWNIGIQHTFAGKYIAEVRYVGTRGLHLPVQTQIDRQNKVTPSMYLPTYLTAPSPATLDGLTTTLDTIEAQSNYVPAYANAGFTNSITSFQPYGKSLYHGLQAQLTRNFTNGLQFQAAWTWSHMFDNSTADVFSTILTPRRPQDFQNFGADYGTSALDRRHRITVALIYDMPFFKQDSNWLRKNVLGNWEIAPIYTFQSPEYVTVQSAQDSNLNGDSWSDRSIINPNGVKGTGSGVTALKNSSGAVVGYLANNPNAQYIVAGAGALATAPRNTMPLPRTNDWDLTVVKKFSLYEKTSVEFQVQALNVLNHAQYVPGSLNQVNSIGYTSGATRSFVTPSSALFNQPSQVFSNQPRTMQLALKFIF